jgi:HSP20 family molecular chaperone IbpA
MRNNRGFTDLNTIFDRVFEVAQNLGDEFKEELKHYEGTCGERSEPFRGQGFGEHVDYYPAYSYPPMNVYMTEDKSLVFEFALAGFDEKDINLSFQGDYMVFSARIAEELPPEANLRFFKRRLKLKDIEKQKYFVPLDKYAQEKVSAVFKNGILKVQVPPKEEPDQEGVKIEIVKEGE